MKHFLGIAVIIVFILTGCSMGNNIQTVDEKGINKYTLEPIVVDTPEPIVTDTPWEETSYMGEMHC